MRCERYLNTNYIIYEDDRYEWRYYNDYDNINKKINDIGYFIVYLRDISDYMSIARFMGMAYPAIPYVIVEAKVCRPEWLIEMECVATPLSSTLAKGKAI